MIIAKILFITLSIFLINALLYLKFGLFKKFYHDILKWHKPHNEYDSEFDGCSFHNTCKYCGKEIIQDSQGNWFEI
jgi:hypothetical protein